MSFISAFRSAKPKETSGNSMGLARPAPQASAAVEPPGKSIHFRHKFNAYYGFNIDARIDSMTFLSL
ncbi:unnamed protein product [Clonostachys rosea]|uniref:Uncharacterized protein n=1 Tax=Bionectria ochroleuca TaxID=29856 RepID=A0ABY6UDU8_BIOOC|nr:unnamed protein product [Clonostachys rosea]